VGMPLHPKIYLDAGKVGTQSRSTVSSSLVSIAQTSKTPFAVTILLQYHHAARLLHSISDQGSRKSSGASRVLRSSPLMLCAKDFCKVISFPIRLKLLPQPASVQYQ